MARPVVSPRENSEMQPEAGLISAKAACSAPGCLENFLLSGLFFCELFVRLLAALSPASLEMA